jgi:hypothetical protein
MVAMEDHKVEDNAGCPHMTDIKASVFHVSLLKSPSNEEIIHVICPTARLSFWIPLKTANCVGMYISWGTDSHSTVQEIPWCLLNCTVRKNPPRALTLGQTSSHTPAVFFESPLETVNTGVNCMYHLHKYSASLHFVHRVYVCFSFFSE